MLLNEICDIRSGYSFRGKVKEEKDWDTKVIQAKDLKAFVGVDFDSLTKTKFKGKASNVFVQDEDILCVGVGSRLYSAVLRNVPDNIVPSSHIWIIRLKSEQVTNDYVSWLINHSQRYFLSRSQGSLVGHINRKMLENMEIKLPSLDVQEKVVGLEDLYVREKELVSQILNKREKLINQIQRNLVNN